MRLRILLPALALLALAGCDSDGLRQTAQAPAKPQACCCQAAATVCPPATPAVAEAPAMTPEPAVYVPPAPRKAATRHHRAVGHARRLEGGYVEVRQNAYAGHGQGVMAQAYDGYVEATDRQFQGQVAVVEAQGAYREHYSEQSESYGSSRRYAEGGGYETRGGGCGGCGPREAAGRDRNGFLTWPGKVPARP